MKVKIMPLDSALPLMREGLNLERE